MINLQGTERLGPIEDCGDSILLAKGLRAVCVRVWNAAQMEGGMEGGSRIRAVFRIHELSLPRRPVMDADWRQGVSLDSVMEGYLRQ